MGVIDKKRDVLNTIKSYHVLKDDISRLDTDLDINVSPNNSKEIVPFLLDLLTTLIGTEVLERAVGELMTDFLRKVEPELKTSLKKQFIGFNSDTPISDVGFDSGFSMPVKDVDSFRKLNTDKSTQVGSLLYGDNLESFDNKARDAIIASGTDVTTGNITVNYNESTDTFLYKPTNTSQTIGDFTNDYIDGLTLIDEKEFTSSIVNEIFGTISTNQNKTQSQLLLEEKLNNVVQKIIDDEEPIINENELAKLNNLAEQKKDGVSYVDVGCGILNSTVSLDDLDTLISTTSGNTDPLTVGRAYSTAMLGGFNDKQNTADENALTIKDGFFKRLINAIVKILVNAVTVTPQIRTLIGITTAFKNNGIPDLGDAVDDINKYLDLITCLSNEAKASINEFIFNMVKKEIMDLVIPVSKKILKEKINSYLRVLKSLIPFKL
jgi:hypothetical protein